MTRKLLPVATHTVRSGDNTEDREPVSSQVWENGRFQGKHF